jgi:hypothetical protein
VPRITPCSVIAGVVMVGEVIAFALTEAGSIAFARPKSKTFTVPIHLAHATLADRRGDFLNAEARAGSEGQTLAVDYTGRAAARTGLLL